MQDIKFGETGQRVCQTIFCNRAAGCTAHPGSAVGQSTKSLARYAHVATGMISAVESPLDMLAQPRKKPRKAPEKGKETSNTEQPPA